MVYTQPSRQREDAKSTIQIVFIAIVLHVSDFNQKLIGQGFIDSWREDTLKPLFDKIKTSMPPDTTSTLSDQQYLDVLTFILKRNGSPEGRRELSADILESVLVTGRNGPEPLPNGAFVQALGCLTRESESSWKLTNASGLVRTKIVRELTSDELKKYDQQRLGRENLVLSTVMFHRFSSGSLDLMPLIDHKVLVVGKLVRKGSDVYVEIVGAHEIAPHCAQ